MWAWGQVLEMRCCLSQCFSVWQDRTAVSIEESRREDEAVQGAVQLLGTGEYPVQLAMHAV